MQLELHTVARDGSLYNACATYNDGIVVVKAGSKINNSPSANFKASDEVRNKTDDTNNVAPDGTVLRDVEFSSLSTAACFVTGRSANGMITWKTADNRYVRYTLKGE